VIQLLTVEDVAHRLQMHPSTVRRLIRDGKLVSRKIGRSVRVEEGDLVAFVRGDSAARAVTTPLQTITPGQLRALHAKADRADRITGQPRGSAKRQAMAEASARFNVELVSASQLDELQAIWVLERLDEIAEQAV
jgi:excisionase family DNA binding protein